LLTDVVKHDTTLNRIRLNGPIRQILHDPGKLEKPIVVQCSKFLGVARDLTAQAGGVNLVSALRRKGPRSPKPQLRFAIAAVVQSMLKKNEPTIISHS
jgi:hypothetical protein